MSDEQRLPDLAERREGARVAAKLGQRFIGQMVAVAAMPILDGGENRMRLVGPAVNHEPAWRLGNRGAHRQNNEAQHRADEKGSTPAEIRRQPRSIEAHELSAGAERSAEPKAGVDDEVGMAAVARRHELLNAGGDCRVFAPDACARKEAE